MPKAAEGPSWPTESAERKRSLPRLALNLTNNHDSLQPKDFAREAYAVLGKVTEEHSRSLMEMARGSTWCRITSCEEKPIVLFLVVQRGNHS